MIRSMMIAAATGLTLSLGAVGAHAQEIAVGDLFKAELCDTDKDGMVTRAEFVAQAGKAYDMMAAKVGAKDGRMNRDQYRRFMAELAKVSPN